MADREKIVSAIEKAKKDSKEYAQDAILVPFKEADMIIALLKEQEAVVRCKDCKHSIVMGGRCWCEKYIPCSLVLSEWFCADGERK